MDRQAVVRELAAIARDLVAGPKLFDVPGTTEYEVTQKPSDKKWYIVGRTGGKYWMPVSDGFRTMAEAMKRAERQPKADAAARGLVREI